MGKVKEKGLMRLDGQGIRRKGRRHHQFPIQYLVSVARAVKLSENCRCSANDRIM